MAFFDKIKNLFNNNDKVSSEESSQKQKSLKKVLKKQRQAYLIRLLRLLLVNQK